MEQFNKLIQTQFKKMCETGKLFRISLTGREVWDLYIKSFKNDPIFRDPASSEHNCNICNSFVRRYGNVVSIDANNEMHSIFDVEGQEEYVNVVNKLSTAIRKAKITEVFFETYNELHSLNYEVCKKTNSVFRLGVAKNVKRYTKEEAEKFGVVKPNETRTFHHMHLDLPVAYVDMSGKSVEALMGEFKDSKNVFQRAMEEISFDTLVLVEDLIKQGSLLDGTTHLWKVEQFRDLKAQYDDVPTKQKDNWCWTTSYKLPLAKFKNELIGTLCSELSEGKELNEACKAWNYRVDPVNYMKTTAPITKKQIEEAKKFVQDNGYEESFDRRFATIEDIKASEILHLNGGDGKLKNVSIFDGVKSTSTRHKRSEFDGVEEIGIEKFMKDILPGCTSIEAFFTSGQEGNLVSLTTANNKESKPIFKWDNNYSWTFNGNLAGKSQIKENVKLAGGKIDGVLRASLQWNDADTPGILDFDFHCKESKGNEIYYGNKKSRTTGGWLDVDMIRPHKIGIENITYQKQPQDMDYSFFVRNFDGGGNKGFKVEIEFNGEVYNYHQTTPVRGDVQVATVSVKKGEFTIKHQLIPTEGTSVSKEIYGLETNNFHKVNLICLSPNHWGENNIGNKHYMFMLEGCKAPSSIRSFHNENLIPALADHRKVLEILAITNQIPSTPKQLSGLGFNSTVNDELIVKLSGSFKRVVKIKFK